VIQFQPRRHRNLCNKQFSRQWATRPTRSVGKHHSLSVPPRPAPQSQEYNSSGRRFSREYVSADSSAWTARERKRVALKSQLQPVHDTEGDLIKWSKLPVSVSEQVEREAEVRKPPAWLTRFPSKPIKSQKFCRAGALQWCRTHCQPTMNAGPARSSRPTQG